MINVSKTEFIVLGIKAQFKKIPQMGLDINGAVIPTVNCVRDLGVLFDECLSLLPWIVMSLRLVRWHWLMLILECLAEFVEAWTTMCARLCSVLWFCPESISMFPYLNVSQRRN